MITAGTVSMPPRMKKAPGMTFIVAAYVALYIGPYTSGINASQTANREFTFPGKLSQFVKKHFASRTPFL